MSISTQVRSHIFSLKEGQLFTCRELLKYGKRGTIDQLLLRLLRKGIIVRVSYGIYMRDTADAWRPSVLEIAVARARLSGKEIYAANDKESAGTDFSGQRSDNLVFFTSGCPSSFTYGGRRIRVRSRSPRNLRSLKDLTNTVAPGMLSAASCKPLLSFAPPGDYKLNEIYDFSPIYLPEKRSQPGQFQLSSSCLERWCKPVQSFPQWLKTKFAWLSVKELPAAYSKSDSNCIRTMESIDELDPFQSLDSFEIRRHAKMIVQRNIPGIQGRLVG